MTPELRQQVSNAWQQYQQLTDAQRTTFLDSLRKSDAEVARELDVLLAQMSTGQIGLDSPLSDETIDHRTQAESEKADEHPTIDHAPALAEDLPQHAGRYLIQSEIARGGMGVVLRALDPDVERTLAVKIMLPKAAGDPDAQRRFLDEAKVTGQLQHPGIAPVHEIGQLDDGRPFFAMKLIEGRTLAQLLRERGNRQSARQSTGKPPVAADLPRLIGVFEQICQTLAYAHSRGILHRDLKPANVMVGAFGEVQVMDWGLAKTRGEGREARDEKEYVSGAQNLSGAQREYQPGAHATGFQAQASGKKQVLTEAGMVMGTLAYMPPEQARGEIDELDERCDVFALGSILAEILTGVPAYFSIDRNALLNMAQQGDLTDAFARLDQFGTNADLVALCKKCLALDKNQRPRNADAVAETVAAYQESVQQKLRQAELEKAEARVQAEEEKKRRLVEEAKAREERRRRRTQLILAVVVVLALTAGVVGATWGLLQVDSARRDAEIAQHNEKKRADGEEKQKVKAQKAETAAQNAAALERTAKIKAQKAETEERRAKIGAQKARDAEEAAKIKANLAAEKERIARKFAEKRSEYVRKAKDIIASIFTDLDVTKIDPSGASLKVLLGRRLKKAVEQLEGDSIGDPVLVADLQNTLAVSLGRLGHIKDALPLLKKAKATRTALLGTDHPDTIATMNNLASVYRIAGDLKQARSLFEEIVRLAKVKLGADHPSTLTYMHNLAGVYLRLNELDKAIPLYEKTIEHLKSKWGPDHPETLASIGDLGEAYRRKGELKKALPLLEESLKATKRQLGVNHPDTLAGMNNLALAYNDSGQTEKALPLLEELYKLAKSALGADHPNTLGTMSNLAETYRIAGYFDRTVALLERALEQLQSKLGVDHPITLTCMNNLAGGYEKMEQFDKAILLHTKTLKLMKAKLGDDHPKTLKSMNNLAMCYRALRQFDKAMPLLERSFEICDSKLGANHPVTIIVMGNVGIGYQETGRFKEAVGSYQKLLSRLPPQHGFHNPVSQRLQICKVLMSQKAMLPRVLKGEKVSNADRLKLAKMCLQYLERYRDAVELYEAAFAADPNVATHLPSGHRYDAALGAVNAAAGKDKQKLSESVRAELQEKALQWLLADLKIWEFVAKKTTSMAIGASVTLSGWQSETALAHLRDAKALAKLPEPVKKKWTALWSDVETCRKMARSRFNETALRGRLTIGSRETAYQVKLQQGQEYGVEMVSKQFDTMLRIEDDAGRKLAENDDVNPISKGLQSVILFKPKQTGTYRVVATSFEQKGLGAYEIFIRSSVDGSDLFIKRLPTIAKEKPPVKKNPPDIKNAIVTVLRGKLTGADPLDTFPLTKKSRRKVHKIELVAGETYLVDVSGVFDTFIRIEDSRGKMLLYNDDVSPPGNLNSRLVFRPAKKNTYRIIVTSYKPATGAYALKIRKAKLAEKSNEIKKELTKKDRKVNARHFHLHKVKLIAGQAYTIELESKTLDTVLILLDATGKRSLGQNDDVAPGNTQLSRIDFTPTATATYAIVATTYAPGATGPYVLRVQSFVPISKEETPKEMK